jgi:hypothetical protein
VPHGESGKVIDVKVFVATRTHELQPGVNELVRVYVAQKRKISEGDKLAGRHGNKGVISKILPEEDMPFLADGTPVDIILNPLGVPSRMNVGQVLETPPRLRGPSRLEGHRDQPVAGTSGHDDQLAEARPYRKTRPRTEPAVYVATPAFDGAHWDDEGAAKDKPTIQQIFRDLNADGANGERLIADESDGKVTLFNGRTGEAYDTPISVGYVYILKLAHLVDDKIHARSTGPYSMITASSRSVVRPSSVASASVRWKCGPSRPTVPPTPSRSCSPSSRDDMMGRVKRLRGNRQGSRTSRSRAFPSPSRCSSRRCSRCASTSKYSPRRGPTMDLADTEEDFFSVTARAGHRHHVVPSAVVDE